MSVAEHPAITRVKQALHAAGQHAAADGMRVLPDEVRTAKAAAEALGVEVGAIANSVVFRATIAGEDVAVLSLTSGAHRVDTGTLARLAGASRVGKADADFVKQHTGQVIGGVAPVGHPRPLLTFVDTALAAYDVVWAAGGHAKAIYPTSFSDLLALTGGRPAAVAEPPLRPTATPPR